MAKRITICAGIDTGKAKLDVAIDGSSEQLQVDNTVEGRQALVAWLVLARRVRMAPFREEWPSPGGRPSWAADRSDRCPPKP